jgi:two-component system cell cycle sensor histidine kinase/response regulator CckA
LRELRTILVVEDTPLVLTTATRILKNAGFTVLAAPCAEEAIRIEADFAGTIHLLLSDVTMPGVPGPDLAKQLKKRRPEMFVILMSGYPGGQLLLLNYGWHFMQKPFVAAALVGRIKEVLRSDTQGAKHIDPRL